jgi:prepilin-type N-terminal cleavage/methylation domain-containing protein
MLKDMSKSFTLVEILIVLAIISILSALLIVIIKPSSIFLNAQDNKRISDIKNIEKTMSILYSDSNFNELNYMSTNTVYISLKDNDPNCSSWLSVLPPLAQGWSYRCSATPTDIDGTLVQFS